MSIRLVKPSLEFLPSYLEALEEGAFCNMALGSFADESAAEIAKNPDEYLRRINDQSPRKVEMPNGDEYIVDAHELLWLVDEKRYLGSVSLRYAGDKEVIEEFGGHIGMAIRPGLLHKGYGVKAAALAWKLSAECFKDRGIETIYVTCNPDNSPSRRLIEHNGGTLLRHVEDAFGFGPSLIFKIDLKTSEN